MLQTKVKYRNIVEWSLSGAGNWEKWRDIDQRVQASSYKISKFWESNVPYVDYSWQYYIIYLKVSKGVDSEYSHHKNWMVVAWSDAGLSNSVGVIIL